MNKYLPYIFIGAVLLGVVGVMTTSRRSEATPTQEVAEQNPSEVVLGSSPVPLVDVQLDTKQALETGIDAELKWLDTEVVQGNKVDFSEASLLDSELGL